MRKVVVPIAASLSFVVAVTRGRGQWYETKIFDVDRSEPYHIPSQSSLLRGEASSYSSMHQDIAAPPCAVIYESLGSASLREALWSAHSLELAADEKACERVVVSDTASLQSLPMMIESLGFPDPFSRHVDVASVLSSPAAKQAVSAAEAGSQTSWGCKRDECAVETVRHIRTTRMKYMAKFLSEYPIIAFTDSDTFFCVSPMPMFRDAMASSFDLYIRPVPVNTRGSWGETTADGITATGRPLVEPPVPQSFPQPHGGFLVLKNTTGTRRMIERTSALYGAYRGEAHPTSDQAAWRAALWLEHLARSVTFGELGQEFGCSLDAPDANRCLKNYTFSAKVHDKSGGKHGDEWSSWYRTLRKMPYSCVLIHQHMSDLKIKKPGGGSQSFPTPSV